MRRQIILPAKALENAGVGTHIISLPAWPRAEIKPVLDRCDRIVFGAMLQPADEAAYREAIRDCGRERRLVFFPESRAPAAPNAFYDEVSSLTHAWFVVSENARARYASGCGWPILVYPAPAESARGRPRVRKYGMRQRAALWLARRHRVGLDAWRLKLLWFGDSRDGDAVVRAIPQLRALAATMPLGLECLTEGGSALGALVQGTKAAADSFRLSEGRRTPETVAAALQECDAVVLPDSGGFIDALNGGRPVVARPEAANEPLRQFGWVGEPIAEGVRWLLSHPQAAFDRLIAGQEHVVAHHSAAALARFWIRALEDPGQGDPLELVARARAAYDSGNSEQAEQYLTRALEANRSLPQAQQLLGNLFQDRGMLDRAITCYRRAIRLEPEFAAAHNDLGTAYVSKGWPEEALACYARAVDLEPTNHVAQANLAQTLLKLGRQREALPHVRAALRHRLRHWMRRTL
ncbi:MAG TPA: tetratricopeptide repeat protein [Burkholderiales bacterium]|nr:tetratricopeptide repeat protein [Burkholderiales bacterium]